MKSTSLAYFISLSALSFKEYESRYTINSKVIQITSKLLTPKDQIQIESDKGNQEIHEPLYESKIFGEIKQEGNKIRFENENDELEHNIDNPCYLYFSEESNVNVNFVYLHDGFPLQVTPTDIFFWPHTNANNFTINIQSNTELNDSNTAVYCGDLSEILGVNAIEAERAQSIRLGSFPADPLSLSNIGYFILTQSVQPNCQVEIHFPIGHEPMNFSFYDSKVEETVSIEINNNGRSYIIHGFDKITISHVKFITEYSSFDKVAYSYNIIAQVTCSIHGRQIDQYDYIQTMKKIEI